MASGGLTSASMMGTPRSSISSSPWLKLLDNAYERQNQTKLNGCLQKGSNRSNGYQRQPLLRMGIYSVLSFDIVCVGTPGSSPDAEENSVIKIVNSVITQEDRAPFVYVAFVLSTASHNIDASLMTNALLMSYKNESDLIESWSEFVWQVDPHCFMEVDMEEDAIKYLAQRAQYLKLKNEFTKAIKASRKALPKLTSTRKVCGKSRLLISSESKPLTKVKEINSGKLQKTLDELHRNLDLLFAQIFVNVGDSNCESGVAPTLVSTLPAEPESLTADKSIVTEEAISTPRPSTPNSFIVDEKCRLSERETLKIMKLLSESENGIAVKDFSQTYFMCFKENIRPSTWNFNRFEDVFKHLMDFIPIDMKREPTSVVYLDADSFRDWVFSCLAQSRYQPIRFLFDVPCDAVLQIPNEDFKYVDIPEKDLNSREKLSFNRFIRVLVTAVRDPDCIWVIKSQTELDMLMEKMKFYHNAALYKVPKELLVKDLICAAPFSVDGEWHRVKVIKLLHQKAKAKVYFVDYGGYEEVDVGQLRFLTKEFVKLPGQAIAVTLEGIKPKNSRNWPTKARDILLEYSEQDYWLSCLFYDKLSDGKYSAHLCDTNRESDMYLHSRLIAENLAIPVSAN